MSRRLLPKPPGEGGVGTATSFIEDVKNDLERHRLCAIQYSSALGEPKKNTPANPKSAFGAKYGDGNYDTWSPNDTFYTWKVRHTCQGPIKTNVELTGKVVSGPESDSMYPGGKFKVEYDDKTKGTLSNKDMYKTIEALRASSAGGGPMDLSAPAGRSSATANRSRIAYPATKDVANPFSYHNNPYLSHSETAPPPPPPPPPPINMFGHISALKRTTKKIAVFLNQNFSDNDKIFYMLDHEVGEGKSDTFDGALERTTTGMSFNAIFDDIYLLRLTRRDVDETLGRMESGEADGTGIDSVNHLRDALNDGITKFVQEIRLRLEHRKQLYVDIVEALQPLFNVASDNSLSNLISKSLAFPKEFDGETNFNETDLFKDFETSPPISAMHVSAIGSLATMAEVLEKAIATGPSSGT